MAPESSSPNRRSGAGLSRPMNDNQPCNTLTWRSTQAGSLEWPPKPRGAGDSVHQRSRDRTCAESDGAARRVTRAREIRPADLDALLDVKLAAVSNAVSGRQHEFAGGRVLLRELLGITDAILVGPTRAPVLPPGVVGSLAHDRDVVIAAVSHDPGVTALGIDVEPAGPCRVV